MLTITKRASLVVGLATLLRRFTEIRESRNQIDLSERQGDFWTAASAFERNLAEYDVSPIELREVVLACLEDVAPWSITDRRAFHSAELRCASLIAHCTCLRSDCVRCRESGETFADAT